MAGYINVSNTGSVNRTPRNYFDLFELADEKEWFSVLQTEVKSNNVAELTSMIKVLKPPFEYLQYLLFLAIYWKHLSAARCLLQSGAEVDQEICSHMCIAKKYSIEVFELLFEYGWDVNSSLGAGDTMLCAVVENEQLVRWLLDHGANPNVGYEIYETNCLRNFGSKSTHALDNAAACSTVDVVNLLLRHGARIERSISLHYAVEAKWTDERKKMVKRLIEIGVDINGSDFEQRNFHGYGTPLMSTLRECHLEQARLLIAHGADPTIMCTHHVTPLVQAERCFVASAVSFAQRLPECTLEAKRKLVSNLAIEWLLWLEMHKATIVGPAAEPSVPS